MQVSASWFIIVLHGGWWSCVNFLQLNLGEQSYHHLPVSIFAIRKISIFLIESGPCQWVCWQAHGLDLHWSDSHRAWRIPPTWRPPWCIPFLKVPSWIEMQESLLVIRALTASVLYSIQSVWLKDSTRNIRFNMSQVRWLKFLRLSGFYHVSPQASIIDTCGWKRSFGHKWGKVGGLSLGPFLLCYPTERSNGILFDLHAHPSGFSHIQILWCTLA